MGGILDVLHDKLCILSQHWPRFSKLLLASPNPPAGSEFTMWGQSPQHVFTEAGPNEVKHLLETVKPTNSDIYLFF